MGSIKSRKIEVRAHVSNISGNSYIKGLIYISLFNT